jgi:hypothetical protein
MQPLARRLLHGLAHQLLHTTHGPESPGMPSRLWRRAPLRRARLEQQDHPV